MTYYGETPPEDYNERIKFMEAKGLLPGTTNEQYQALQGLGSYLLIRENFIDGSYIVRIKSPHYRVDTDGSVTLTGEES